jgi:hypothetical protein
LVKYTYYDVAKAAAFENLKYMLVSEVENDLVFTFIDAPLSGPI